MIETSVISDCDPVDCSPPSPPGYSVNGILEARILEWLAMPSSTRSDPETEPAFLMSSA